MQDRDCWRSVDGVFDGAAEALRFSQEKQEKMLHRHISCSAVLTMGHLEVPWQAQSSAQPTQDDVQKNQQQKEEEGLPYHIWEEVRKPSPELPKDTINSY